MLPSNTLLLGRRCSYAGKHEYKKRNQQGDQEALPEGFEDGEIEDTGRGLREKLIEKVRDGAKVRKVHDEAKTPYQRIMDDENVDSDIKERLKRQYLSINPVTIRKEILELVQELRKRAVRPMRGGGIVG